MARQRLWVTTSFGYNLTVESQPELDGDDELAVRSTFERAAKALQAEADKFQRPDLERKVKEALEARPDLAAKVAKALKEEAATGRGA